MATRDGIVAVFRALKAAGVRTPDWTSAEDKRAALAVWEAAAQTASDEELMSAAISYLRQVSPFWPIPGQLLALIPARRISALDLADLAWGLVQKMISRHGRDYPPGGPDWRGKVWDFAADQRTAIHAGIAAVGGWSALCAMETDEIPAQRASFRGAYRAVLEGRRVAVEGEATGALAEGSVAAYERRLADAWGVGGWGPRQIEQVEES